MCMKIILDKLQYQTVTRRGKIDFILRLLDYKRSIARRKEASLLSRETVGGATKFKNDGIIKIQIRNQDSEKTINSVIEYCEKIYNDSIVFENRSKKNYLRAVRKDLEFDPTSPIMQLAFNKEIVSIVAQCLNDFPVLANIALFYSPPSIADAVSQYEGSQLFHMDEEDVSLCKLWLLIDNVSESDGPTVIIKKNKSFEIANKIAYKKGQKIPSDDKILGMIKESDLLSVTGKRGDVYLLDTAGVFHYGSRVSDVSDGRYMLMISYSTSFNLDHGLLGRTSRLKSINISAVKSDLNSKHRKMLVDGSVY